MERSGEKGKRELVESGTADAEVRQREGVTRKVGKAESEGTEEDV